MSYLMNCRSELIKARKVRAKDLSSLEGSHRKGPVSISFNALTDSMDMASMFR